MIPCSPLFKVQFQKINTSPMEYRSVEIPRGGEGGVAKNSKGEGSGKAKVLREKKGANLEFPEG